MSPWTVYWVMQADSICVGVFILTLLAAAGAIGCGAGAAFEADCNYSFYDEDEKNTKKARSLLLLKYCKRLTSGSAFLVFVCLFLPSTKTLCAVIAVPAVINNEQLQADAADIYKLGMERLKEELGGEEAKEPQ